MSTLDVFSPCHVTGLFYVPELPQDLLYQSSLGAGFSISLGVKTRLTHRKRAQSSIRVLIDGREDSAEVSRKVVTLFQEQTGIEAIGELTVEHRSEVPLRSGFGTSAAGAIGLAMGLPRLFDVPMNAFEAAQLAHRAEILCSTGMSTVMGEIIGGLKILTVPGAPGIGTTEGIPFADDTEALFVTFGPYRTDEALNDRNIMNIINRLGKEEHRKLLDSPSLEQFLLCSQDFSRELGLLTPECEEILRIFNSRGLAGGMQFFGNGVFTLGPSRKIGELEEHLASLNGPGRIIRCGLEPKGFRYI